MENKIYYNNGQLKYEGGILNNRLHGYGKLYNKNGKLIYRGEFKDGKMDGTGQRYFEKIAYFGEFKNDKMNGHGTMYLYDGFPPKNHLDTSFKDLIIYEGQFKDNMWNGQGREYGTTGLAYEGEFKEGLRNGKGKKYYDGVLLYEGEFVDGKKYGFGTSYYVKEENKLTQKEMKELQIKNGEKYYITDYVIDEEFEIYLGVGSKYLLNNLEAIDEYSIYMAFMDNKDNYYFKLFEHPESKKMVYHDFDGNAIDVDDIVGEINAFADMRDRNYSRDKTIKRTGIISYKGEFKNGSKHGYGIKFDNNGCIKYKGQFIKDKEEGIGKSYYQGMVIFEGAFEKGEFTGNGKIYDKEGTLICEGPDAIDTLEREINILISK